MVNKRHANNHADHANRPVGRSMRESPNAPTGISARLCEVPITSLAVGFGIGLAVGWLVAGSVHRSPSEQPLVAFERIGRSVVDAVASVVPESFAKRFAA